MAAVALWIFVPARDLEKGNEEGEEGNVMVPPRPKMEYHEEYVKEAWDQLMGIAWKTRHEMMGGKAYICKCSFFSLAIGWGRLLTATLTLSLKRFFFWIISLL